MSDFGNGYTAKGSVDVSWWVREVYKGIQFRRKHANEGSWERWRRYYRGQWNRDVLPVNLFFRMARTMVPRIYFRNPSIVLTPGKPGLEQMIFSQILEGVDNKLFRTMKVKQQVKRIVQHAFFFGTGVGKLGYGAQYTYSPEFGTTSAPQTGKGEILEYNSAIRQNMPWFMATHPGQFILPDGTVSYQDCRWSGVWTRRPVWDVESDPRLKNNKNMRGNAFSDNLPPHEKMTRQADMVDLVEIRDLKMRKVFVLAPYNTDRVLYEGPDDLQVNGRMSNYLLVFNEDDEHVWGVPDSVILEPQQLEVNETRTLMMRHRRATIAKILAKRNAISEDEAMKLTSEEVSAVIYVDGEPLSDVRFTEGTGIPDDLFKAQIAIENDVRENIGFSRNQVGNYAEGSQDRSATESKIVNLAAEIRLDERRDMIADMLVDMTEDMHSIIFDQWQGDMVAALLGPEGVPVWVSYRPSMLANGQYEVMVDPDNALPITREQREQRAHLIYTQLKPNPMIHPVMLTRWYLQQLSGSQMDFLINPAALAAMTPGASPGSPMGMEQYMGELQNSPQLQQILAAGGGPGATA